MTKKFKDYLTRFESEITDVDTAFRLLIHLNKCLNTRRKEMELSPCFFTYVLKSLLHYIIITLSKLYENYKGNERSDFNLIKFLNFIEQNGKTIFKDEVKKTTIDEDRYNIQKQKGILDNLFNWRDKYVAHFSKKLLKPEEVSKMFPITEKDFEKLINISKEIVNKYCIISGKEKLVFEIVNFDDIDNIFYTLEKINKKHINT